MALFPASFFADFQIVPVAIGAGLYVFIAVIAIRALRGVSEGYLRLTRLETVGLYLLWAAFALSFVARAGESALYLTLTLAAFASLVARLLPERRRAIT